MEIFYIFLAFILGALIASLIVLSIKNNQLHQHDLSHQEQLAALRSQLSTLQTQLENEKEKSSREEAHRNEQFKEQLRTVQEQFANLATTVLEKTQQRLKTENAESMNVITAPLKENLGKLHFTD